MNKQSILFTGEVLELRASRTVWWERAGVLFIADLHLGANLRTSDPNALDDHKIQRLHKELGIVDPDIVCILGDLVHASATWTAAFEDRLRRLRENYFDRKWLLIEGNHDCSWRQRIRELEIDVETPPRFMAPFWLMHDAAKEASMIPIERMATLVHESPSDSLAPTLLAPNGHEVFSICGHIHPAISRMNDVGVSSKQHCFCISSNQLILPSFATERSTRLVEANDYERVFAIDDQRSSIEEIVCHESANNDSSSRLVLK